jgi:hypothetical protein
LKKITYSLRIGVIGSLNSGKEFVFDYLKEQAIRFSIPPTQHNGNNLLEFLIVHENVPIKVKIFSTKDLQQAIMNNDKIERLDILIFTLNMHDYNSLNLFYKDVLDDLYQYLEFKGISVLMGYEEMFSSRFLINKLDLINKAKELDTLYCYKIQDKKDLTEMFKKLLGDFIFKFQYSNPEIFGQAIAYGIELSTPKEIDEKN